MTKVLILYGTRYGTTKEISDDIEKKIQEKGITTESYNLKEHSIKKIPPLADYDGVIIGTGIKMNMWTKVVKNFLQKRKSELQNKQNRLAFYVCCGEATKKSGGINEAINKYINLKFEKFGIQPELIDAFGGAYDLREGSSISGMTRKIIIAALKEEEGIEEPDGKMHDYRDWEQIKDFVYKFCELLNK